MSSTKKNTNKNLLAKKHLIFGIDFNFNQMNVTEKFLYYKASNCFNL